MPNPLPSADQLQMLVEEVELSILNYCNIAEVPEALKFVWANMVVDYWRFGVHLIIIGYRMWLM